MAPHESYGTQGKLANQSNIYMVVHLCHIFDHFSKVCSPLCRRVALTSYSLMDACSGYEASYLTFFEWPNGTLENTDDFSNSDGCK
jgi:hypothetical protein